MGPELYECGHRLLTGRTGCKSLRTYYGSEAKRVKLPALNRRNRVQVSADPFGVVF